MSEVSSICRGEVQGLALYGYGHHSAAAFVGLRVRDAARARAALRRLAERVTWVGDARGVDYLNVAFSVEGLRALGTPDDVLAWFPVELRQGMAARAQRLGDVGPSAPGRWRWGAGERAVHVMLLLYALNEPGEAPGHPKGRPDGARLWRLVRETVRAVRTADDGGRALEVVVARTTRALPGSAEPFGFRDGIVQPELVAAPDEADRRPGAIPLGELVLGQPNAYGEIPVAPRAVGPEGEVDLGAFGTYLVVRELEQDVATFWQTLRERARERLLARGAPEPDEASIREEATILAAKMVGRWPNGRPLREGEVLRGRDAWAPTTDPDEPSFQRDRIGRGCPLGAHVRRANPRDALGDDGPRTSLAVVRRHRLVRRGRPFGPALDPFAPDDGRRRGLVFAAVGASVRRQFEFLQQQWLENPTFQGPPGEDDPLVGQRVGLAGDFSIPGEPWRERVRGLPRFVRTRGGGYFFMPGRAALEWIVGSAAR